MPSASKRSDTGRSTIARPLFVGEGHLADGLGEARSVLSLVRVIRSLTSRARSAKGHFTCETSPVTGDFGFSIEQRSAESPRIQSREVWKKGTPQKYATCYLQARVVLVCLVAVSQRAGCYGFNSHRTSSRTLIIAIWEFVPDWRRILHP